MTTLAEVHTAWDKTEGDGRDEVLTRSLSDAYVDEHPEEFDELSKLEHDELVQAIDVFRAAGLKESVDRIQVWLWHKFDPQNIGGAAQITVRVS